MTLSEEIYSEINLARTDPKSLIPDLKKMKTFFKGKEYRNPKLKYYLMTEEGIDAVNDAIHFLENKVFKKNALERDEAL